VTVVGLGFNVPDELEDSDEGEGETASLDGGWVVPGSLVDCEARNRRVGKEGCIGRDRLDVPRYLVH
jgi:hypothetical protein